MLTHMLISPYHCYGYFDPISMENRIGGDGFGTVFGGLRQFRALSGGLRKPVVSHHAQI
jgi:hypothetical protein